MATFAVPTLAVSVNGASRSPWWRARVTVATIL
jgi:hypothetical protein